MTLLEPETRTTDIDDDIEHFVCCTSESNAMCGGKVDLSKGFCTDQTCVHPKCPVCIELMRNPYYCPIHIECEAM